MLADIRFRELFYGSREGRTLPDVFTGHLFTIYPGRDEGSKQSNSTLSEIEGTVKG